MISCTEFIPAYSELFRFIEERYGRCEVDAFWEYLFRPTGEGIPLITFLEKEGIAGCFTYWSGTLNEEAADFSMFLNEKAGWFMLEMHHCPSKGRLLSLEEETGFQPYRDYCLHCDHYRAAVEKAGYSYIYNFAGTDRASCSLLIYDPKVFDGRVVIDEHTRKMNRQAAENEYYHPDFHSSMNMGVHYLGETYGEDVVKAYLTEYTQHVHRSFITQAKQNGLTAIEQKIRDIYRSEKAEDVLQTKLCDHLLTVQIKHCPAVRHLTSTGRTVSPWYRYVKETVLEVLADAAGVSYEPVFYDVETGASEYRFVQ